MRGLCIYWKSEQCKDAQRGGCCLCWNNFDRCKTTTPCCHRASRGIRGDERYHPELEEELKECLFCLKRNEMMFDLEVDTDLIEQRIYERQALLCRYRYLLARARELGLHTVLTKYQPQI